MNLLAIAIVASALAGPASANPAPCPFLDATELAKLQSARAAETKGSVRSEKGFEIRRCFYRLDPFSSSVSLEVTRPDPAVPGRLRERWAAIFHDESRPEGRSKDEEREERPRERPVAVSGVGEEAFWVPNPASGALYVLGRDSYFRLSVGGGDAPGKKLEKCRVLAEKVLARLPAAR